MKPGVAWSLGMLCCLAGLAGCLGADPAPPAVEPGAAADPDEVPTNATLWPPGALVAEGEILIGSPTTYVRSLVVLTGVAGVDSFRYAVPATNLTLTTRTVDGSGAGFNVDLYFHDADGGYLGGCATLAAGEETCAVPPGAATGTVDAVWGSQLSITVHVAPDAPGTSVQTYK